MTHTRGSVHSDRRPVVVTGAGGGIGAATVLQLAELGYRVIAADLQLGWDLPADVEFVELDVSQGSAWRELAVRLADNGVRGLVNNAGVAGAGNVETETEEAWDRVVAVNQTGVFLGMKHLGPAMVASGGGSIVNVASILSSSGGFGSAVAYHATKGAVASMSKSAAVHWASAGVRVNSVHPGFVATPMTLPLQQIEVGPGTTLADLVHRRTPMGRVAEPHEIAPVIEFLLSDRASFVTGSEYYADGGWNAG